MTHEFPLNKHAFLKMFDTGTSDANNTINYPTFVIKGPIANYQKLRHNPLAWEEPLEVMGVTEVTSRWPLGAMEATRAPSQ